MGPECNIHVNVATFYLWMHGLFCKLKTNMHSGANGHSMFQANTVVGAGNRHVEMTNEVPRFMGLHFSGDMDSKQTTN